MINVQKLTSRLKNPALKSFLLTLKLTVVLSFIGILQVSASGFPGMQQKAVTGTVVDLKTGDPVAGATIQVKGTSMGAFTDVAGKFSINIPDKSATLVCSFIGYQTLEIEVTEGGSYNIALVEEAKQLEEVVVIGYGSRQKKDITTAIGTVSSKDIENLSVSTGELAMQGKMAGVYVASGGNIPSARPTIRIRGTSTFNISDPLYIIDGVPVWEFGAGVEQIGNWTVQDLRSPINVMAMINPDDIEQISVLKDAAACAIYGVRASNGVVLITTKKGKTGKSNLEFSMSKGWQNLPKKYDVIGTGELVDLAWEMDEANPNQTRPVEFLPSSPNYVGNMPTYDWQEEYLNKNAPVESYNLRMSGGNENIDYYVSAGYDNQEAAVVQNNLKKYSVAANVNGRLNKYFGAGLNSKLMYIRSLDNNIGSNGRVTMQMLGQYSPWQPIYDDGDPTRWTENNLWGYMPAYDLYDNAGAYSPAPLWGEQTTYNVFGMFASSVYRYTILRNITSGYVELKPFDGLTIKGSMSIDNYTNRRYDFHDKEHNWFLQTPQNPWVYGDNALAEDSQGDYFERETTNTTLIGGVNIHYVKSFGDHNIDAVFNAEEQRWRWQYADASTEYVTTEDISRVRLGGASEFTGNGSDFTYTRTQGYLARVSYNFANKYYLDGTIRRDGSTRFMKDYRWGWFPGIAAAWRISAEPFMSNLTFINDMKIRIGYGQLGNQETTNFAYLSGVNRLGMYPFGSGLGDPKGVRLSTLSLPGMPNREMIWEKQISQNYAVEAILLKNIDFTFEYYNKVVDGILQYARIPSSTGITATPPVNIGKVKNNGIEVSLGYRGKIGDLNYRISGNITTNSNEVLSVYNDVPQPSWNDGNLWLEEGYPVNYIKGFQTDGIIQDNDQLAEYLSRINIDSYGNRGMVSVGDFMFKDVNGDSILNDKDRLMIGNTQPGLYYGFNLDLSYKGIDFNASFTGVGDLQKISYNRMWSEAMANPGDNQTTSIRERWQPTNPSNTMPRAVLGDPAGNTRMSDRWVDEAGYLRLAHVELGYTLPRSVLNYLKIADSFRVYAAVNNLFTLSKWSGLDPENEGFPSPRVVMVGVKATF
jgi:TonB-linked SusC/RagA family outer membrane protein